MKYKRVSWKTACKIPREWIEYNVVSRYTNALAGAWVDLKDHPVFQLEKDFGKGKGFRFRVKSSCLTKLGKLFYKQ